MALSVSAITIYPVKSCGRTPLTESEIVETGFAHDREWMVVRENGWFVTQRQYPRMALIQSTVLKDGLRLEAPGMPAITVPLSSSKKIQAQIWNDAVTAADQGDEVAAWLSKFLEAKLRLVHMAGQRRISKDYQVSGEEIVSLADGFPFLLISQASLDDLNKRLDDPVLMTRFRPNIVVGGGTAFQEDEWKKIRIGDVTFRVCKPCARCEIPTINQESAEKDVEPIETLGTYRYRTRGIMFGQNLVQENVGTIHVGDAVEILA